MTAVSWYVKHFEGFKTVVKELDNDSTAVENAKNLIDNSALMAKLVFIKANFKTIPTTIEQLQGQDVLFTTSVAKMKDIANTDFPGTTGEKINRIEKRWLG